MLFLAPMSPRLAGRPVCRVGETIADVPPRDRASHVCGRAARGLSPFGKSTRAERRTQC